jgi:hypothetical protein
MKMRITLLLGVCTLATSTTANAQTAPGATTGEATPASQAPSETDIVVTAQKRTQSVQDVPLAVQVVTAQQLEVNAVRDFADLNRVAPSLVVRPAENPVNANISIRGIGTLAFSPGVEPSVAIVVDDVPIAFQARAFAALWQVGFGWPDQHRHAWSLRDLHHTLCRPYHGRRRGAGERHRIRSHRRWPGFPVERKLQPV